MLQKDEISQILASAEAHGIEFAELFFEDREETNIPCVESVIQGVKSLRICGVGLYLIQGLSNVYLYTNQVTKEALLELVKKGADMLEIKEKAAAAGIVLTENIGTIRVQLSNIRLRFRIRIKFRCC